MKKDPFFKKLEDYFQEGTDAFLPHLSVNCVVLGYDHPHLKVLVHRLFDLDFWSLPGGFIRKFENLDDAAHRNLSIWGINDVFLRQIRTFGDADRTRGFSYSEISNTNNEDIIQWTSQRFVTVVYYGLVNFKDIERITTEFATESAWWKIDKLENMQQDHGSIVKETRNLLQTEIFNLPVASSLLPEFFTLKELRGLFEAILNRSIDRGTFRRKMLKLGIIEQVDQRKDTLGRPSHLFRFNQKTYDRFLAEQNKFGF